MSAPAAAFGPGIVIVTRTDVSPSPAVNIGYAQELTLDFAGSTKQLFGQNQFPLVAARSTIKVSGKIKSAVLSGIAANNVFFGGAFASSGFSWTIGEQGTVAGASDQYQTSGHSTFDADLGVNYAGSGLPLQRVGSITKQGQYSEASGIYTFHASNSGTSISVTYTTTAMAAGAQSLTVANQPIGFTPTFQLDYYTNLNQPAAEPFALRLFSCVASKLSMPFKLEDFMMPEFDFDVFANASGNIFELVMPQIA